jgi:hypothetical protein
MLSARGRVKFLTRFTWWVKLNSLKGRISLLVQFLLKKGETKRKTFAGSILGRKEFKEERNSFFPEIFEN